MYFVHSGTACNSSKIRAKPDHVFLHVGSISASIIHRHTKCHRKTYTYISTQSMYSCNTSARLAYTISHPLYTSPDVLYTLCQKIFGDQQPLASLAGCHNIKQSYPWEDMELSALASSCPPRRPIDASTCPTIMDVC